LRRNFHQTYIVNGGFDLDSANAAIHGGKADLVALAPRFSPIQICPGDIG